MIFLRANRDTIIQSKITVPETNHRQNLSIPRIALHRAKNFLAKCIPCKELALDAYHLIMATRTKYLGLLEQPVEEPSDYGNRTYAPPITTTATDLLPFTRQTAELTFSCTSTIIGPERSTSEINIPTQSSVLLEGENVRRVHDESVVNSSFTQALDVTLISDETQDGTLETTQEVATPTQSFVILEEENTRSASDELMLTSPSQTLDAALISEEPQDDTLETTQEVTTPTQSSILLEGENTRRASDELMLTSPSQTLDTALISEETQEDTLETTQEVTTPTQSSAVLEGETSRRVSENTIASGSFSQTMSVHPVPTLNDETHYLSHVQEVAVPTSVDVTEQVIPRVVRNLFTSVPTTLDPIPHHEQIQDFQVVTVREEGQVTSTNSSDFSDELEVVEEDEELTYDRTSNEEDNEVVDRLQPEQEVTEIVVPAFDQTPVGLQRATLVQLNNRVETHVTEDVQLEEEEEEARRLTEDEQGYADNHQDETMDERNYTAQDLAIFEQNALFRRRMQREVVARRGKIPVFVRRDLNDPSSSEASSEYFDAQEETQPVDYNTVIENIVGPCNSDELEEYEHNPYKVLCDLGPLLDILKDNKYYTFCYDDPNKVYVIDRDAEGGGMNGGVHKARFRNDTTRRLYAMKTVLVDFHKPTYHGKLTEIRSEVRLLRQEHDRLARLCDLRIYNGRVFIFTDYMPYTLTDIIQMKYNSGIHNDVLVHIFLQSMEGLDYINNTLAMVHGDIKGCNIMMDKDGNIKLIDFGFSGYPTDSPGSGTEAFMSPELAAGGPNTAASDAWALGKTFQYLLDCNKGHREPYLKLICKSLMASTLEARITVRLAFEMLDLAVRSKWLEKAEPQTALNHVASNA
ncbi:uncharacterized protein EV154DRAFT_566413 [Mucor mucedo]|uniref:uncharacterized protein n=1 Tax=Mucor mucedo TaxID=29922 RepID=UPI00221F3F36|nr:uncharacterized protein EV154DRAFT_566413 [Mucor mucedo]KAI7888404.1 hypothetical protein EV154DRAFT_566413 [Mucor mucedo]